MISGSKIKGSKGLREKIIRNFGRHKRRIFLKTEKKRKFVSQ